MACLRVADTLISPFSCRCTHENIVATDAQRSGYFKEYIVNPEIRVFCAKGDGSTGLPSAAEVAACIEKQKVRRDSRSAMVRASPDQHALYSHKWFAHDLPSSASPPVCVVQYIWRDGS